MLNFHQILMTKHNIQYTNCSLEPATCNLQLVTYNQQTTEAPFVKEKIDSDKENSHFLILFNDDFNTFDFVIDSLMEICKLEAIQAEQCTQLIHYKGKCDVKKGAYKKLKTMKDALIDRGLTAEIN